MISVDDDREWQILIELQPQQPVEEEITVHATRTDTRLQDSPMRVEVLGLDEIEEKTMMTPGDIVMMLNERRSAGANDVPFVGRRQRPDSGNTRAIHPIPDGWAAAIRATGRRTRAVADSSGRPWPGRSNQRDVIRTIWRRCDGRCRDPDLAASGAEPVREILINRSTLGATDASVFLASQLSSRWSASFLGGGDWQERKDRNADGWADLAGYSRGVVKPRFFWDGGNGRTGFVTGGVTYENRSGGTLPNAVLAATGHRYIEALNTRRYDAGGSF